MPFNNSPLASELNSILARDKRTADSQIEAVDDGGVITLAGNALSNDARLAAAEIAESHPGVLSVVNDLTVNDPEATSEMLVVPPPIGIINR